ncbi:MAG: hypothetical protein ACI868_001939, partial [Granulosicoccus sp.]
MNTEHSKELHRLASIALQNAFIRPSFLYSHLLGAKIRQAAADRIGPAAAPGAEN